MLVGVLGITGVEAIRLLNEDGFILRDKEELSRIKFGRHAQGIVNYVAERGSISQPDTVADLSYHANISKKQGMLALDCMVNRKDPVFTKFKDSDILMYSKLYCNPKGVHGRIPIQSHYAQKSWLQEALDDLTMAIDDLGGAVDYLNEAVHELGQSRVAYRLFGNPEKERWNYVPLVKRNDIPVYENMRLRIIR
jgi:hypothetical protein